MTSSFAITDFPDRLSPMVVKELRQGMRTRQFGGVILLLHLTLVLFTLMSGGVGNADAVVGGWFDGIITLVLCVILPLRGFSAVADELKAGTLDMLVLTRLSAGRIIFGKWAAIALQSLLIAFSILPYVVARFVFGGLDLFDEVAMLFYKWLAGVVVAAVIVALSTQRQFWLRAVIVGLPLLMGGCGAASFFMVSRMGGGMPAGGIFAAFTTAGGRGTTWVSLGLAAWAIFFFLSLAATRIAPAASMLSVIKRPVHLGVLLVLILVGWSTGTSAAVTMVSAGMLSLIMLDALTERVNEVPSVYAAFYRRGWLGRVALWLMAPGWVTGFVFTVLVVGMVAVQVRVFRSVEEAQLVVISAAGVWLVAALIQVFPTRKARDLLLPFMVCWLMINVLTGMLGTLLLKSFAMRSSTAWLTAILPQWVPVGYATAQPGDKAALLELGTLAAGIWPVVLMIAACFAWRQARGARQEGWRMVHGVEGGAKH